MKNLLVKAFLIILVVGLVSATSFAADPGADLFKSKCQMCHGPNGDASGAMAKNLKLKPLSDAEMQKLAEADIVTIITKGKGKMKPVASLTPDQAKEVAKYVKSLK